MRRVTILVQPEVTEYVIVTLPVATAVTRPVIELTVAIALLELLHVPPASPDDDNVAVGALVRRSVKMPVLLLMTPGLGPGLTVATVVLAQPVAVRVKLMTVVPALSPVITPKAAVEPVPMVATDVLLLLHVPPDVASLIVVATGIHTDGVPLIAAGSALTVYEVVTLQVELIV
jgi:hypothetical protein